MIDLAKCSPLCAPGECYLASFGCYADGHRDPEPVEAQPDLFGGPKRD